MINTFLCVKNLKLLFFHSNLTDQTNANARCILYMKRTDSPVYLYIHPRDEDYLDHSSFELSRLLDQTFSLKRVSLKENF